jgi:hypothetical protein
VAVARVAVLDARRRKEENLSYVEQHVTVVPKPYGADRRMKIRISKKRNVTRLFLEHCVVAREKDRDG